MAQSRPVFVAGCNRSGTSALRQTLERHPAFRCPGVRSPETRAIAHPRRIGRLLERAGRPLLRFMADDEDAARRLLAILESETAWGEDRDVHWLRLYFDAAQSARGAPRLFEKTPRHVFHLDRLFAAFPRARVILTIRHPVDVYSSLRKRRRASEAADRWPRPGGWQHLEPVELAELWNEIAAIVRTRADDDAERCHLLRYEDLTADPPGRLEALCRFVGEPFDAAAMLERVDEARDAHGSPSPDTRLGENRKRWQDFVSDDGARAIEDASEEAMASLGYERYTRRSG